MVAPRFRASERTRSSFGANSFRALHRVHTVMVVPHVTDNEARFLGLPGLLLKGGR